jgi:ribonucleoside-diphosphate reductase alpha chain
MEYNLQMHLCVQVEENADWDLRSPHDQSVQKTVSARSLWIRMLTARIETGEPYLGL